MVRVDPLVERRKEELDAPDREVRRAPYSESRHKAARSARFGDRDVEGREYLARFRSERESGAGRRDALAAALEQLNTELLLEGPYRKR